MYNGVKFKERKRRKEECMDLLLHTETTIDSSHRLVGYDGKCNQVHGHTWFVDLWIKGDPKSLDKDGILFDFGGVKSLKDYLDHKYINDLPEFKETNPTAENLSVFIYGFFKRIKPTLSFKVRLYETKVGKETWCEYGDW